MKEDILEQLVDDYLQQRGYFTQHNLKFRPRNDHADFQKHADANHSDIDVLGYNPQLRGVRRVVAVSCKSWQGGLDVRSRLDQLEGDKTVSGRKAWQHFRELWKPKWSEAFIARIKAATGKRQFTYVTAVTKVSGNPAEWENYPRFREAMGGNPVRILTLGQMLGELLPAVGTTVAPSQFGRTIQLLKAAGLLDTGR